MNKISKNFHAEWDNIQDTVEKHWDKFKSEDLSDIGGSYDKFVAKLREVYGFSFRQAEAEVDFFMENLDIIKEKILKEGSSYAREAWNHLTDSITKYQKKITRAEKDISGYIKKNPVTAIGIATIAGFTIAKLMDLRKML